MHELIFFSMFLLVLIRVVGVIVSVNFYHESKSNTYIYFIIGWFFWIIAGIVALLSAITYNQIQEKMFLLMNYIIGPIAIFFLAVGLSSYYIKISTNKIKYISVLLIIFPLIVNFSIGIVLVGLYARIFQFLGIILAFLLPFLKYDTFKKRIGKSIRWYYLTCFSIVIYIPLAISNMINSALSGSFQSQDLAIIIGAYSSIILMTILLIAFIIHLEYTISNEQHSQLKDKYSHDLGNIMQVIYSSAELFKRILNIEKIDNDKLDLIEKKCREASKLIKEIRNI
ncbi:MAG: hypothetical protein ACFE9I_15610 [Candidatus Hermodarchaeota archaeon]